MNLFRSSKKNIKEKIKKGFEKEEPLSSEFFTGIFSQDLQRIQETFKKSSDIVVRTFSIGLDTSIHAAIIYTDGLADSTVIQNFILESLMIDSNQKGSETIHYPRNTIIQRVKDSILTVGKITDIKDFETLFTDVLSGNTVILIEGFCEAISASTAGWEDRGVSEPTSQTVVRGPREGFSENLRTNTALVRRKIKDSNLYCEQKQIGKVTKTSIAIMYINGIVNDKVVKEVHHRLDKIDIGGVLESGYIEELIQDDTFTPFPTIFNSERPDVVAACLLEGRVAILVDGTPFVLVVPSLFIQNFQ
ncbi:MAG: spore germination protein, partial [Bacillota bacterium]|nr:spore germination protein [Bacillota bacterium]